jgi:hypothetical protein
LLIHQAGELHNQIALSSKQQQQQQQQQHCESEGGALQLALLPHISTKQALLQRILEAC